MAKYKYILTLIITLCAITTFAQPSQYTPMTASGYQMKRLKVDSTLHLPSFCGVPTLRNSTVKEGALAIDTCNGYLFMWTNQDGWDTVNTSGGVNSNTFVDSIYRTLGKDSIFYKKNGITYAIKDSVGGGDFWKTSGTTDLTSDVTISTDNNLQFSGINDEMKQFYVLGEDIKLITSTNQITLSGLQPLSDTSTYKPLGIDNNGLLAPLTYWPSGGGTSTDTTSLSNRINLKVPYTGATQDVDLGAFKISAQSFQVEGTNGLGHIHFKHQNSDATATGQSTVLYANTNGDLKYKNAGNYYSTLKTQQTADRVYTFQNKSYTLADSSDLSAKLNATDTTVFQRKSISAYTVLANNTSATANATAQNFRDTSGVYTGTITFTGTTAPSGATNHSYRLTQVGKCVTLHIALVFATNGAALSAVQMTLPTGAPTPAQPTGLTGSIFNMYPVSAQLVNSVNQSIFGTLARGFVRNNTAATGFEIFITFSSSAVGQVGVIAQYWTN